MEKKCVCTIPHMEKHFGFFTSFFMNRNYYQYHGSFHVTDMVIHSFWSLETEMGLQDLLWTNSHHVSE